jgi:hypothetical protein
MASYNTTYNDKEYTMANLIGVLKQLQLQKDGLERNISRLDLALKVLGGLDGAGTSSRGGRRNMSASSRRRIAMAQKKRWAKWRVKHKKR